MMTKSVQEDAPILSETQITRPIILGTQFVYE